MRQDDDDGDPLTALAEQVDLFILRDHASTGDALLDLGNPHCNLGFEVRHHHGSMLVANVTARNLAALRPIIRLFSRYGMNEGGQPDPPRNTRIPGGRTQLLADLFSTLHVHYSAHTQNVDRAFDTELQHPDFDKQYGTGFRRAEPYAVGIVRDPGSNPPGGARRDLFSVFLRFGALLDRTAVCLTETSPGRSCPPDLEVNAAEEVVTFVAWLLDRDARVCPREERWAQWGSAPETDAATEATLCTHSAGPMRGRRLESDRERRPSRLQLLIEAFRLVDDRLRVPSRAGAKAAWEHLNLLDLLLEVDDQGELANRGTVHVVRVALSILSDSLADAWSSYGCNPLDPLMAEPCKGFVEETDDFYTESRRFLGTAELADTLALLGVVRADPELRQWVDMLLAVMVHASDDPEQDVSGALLSLLAHVIQLDVGEDDVLEVVRFLGRVLEADSWYANRLVATLGRLREADEGHVVAALLRNLTTEDRRSARSRFPLRTLKDVIADASRPDPAETGPYTAEDYRAVVRKTRDFMRDEIHGFQRIVDVTKSRLP